jgi:hypothetical protein
LAKIVDVAATAFVPIFCVFANVPGQRGPGGITGGVLM